jgi:type IV pilus assembly protein PilY1
MRMRWPRSLTAASSLIAVASVTAPASAQQLDLNPPKPNVLLLIDNSGSMERMIDGNVPETEPANACDVSSCNVGPLGTTCTWAATPPAAPNRWNTLQNALVGSPANGFHCIAESRNAGSSSTFAQEYQIAGVAPYDTGYYLAYHRAVAMDTTTSPGTTIPCTMAPGDLPGATTPAGVGPNGYGAGGTADSFPPNAIVTRPYGQVTIDQSVGHTMACQFALNADGALLAYQDILRFSFMTFDQDPSPGTGVSSSSPWSVVNPAFTGMWSYFPNWGGGGTAAPVTGNPVGCVPQSYEVGARNPAAPPWEGRLVPFSPSSDAAAARETQNQQIRSVLSATRPYGATPMAGMLADAMTYLWTDPTGPGIATNDEYIANGCRQQYIIILTDGAPNEDLRPQCGTQDNPSAPCPYNQPYTTVANLLAGGAGHQPIQTFVIGFAVSSGTDQGGTLVKCATLNPSSTDCLAANVTPSLAPCCELQKIAIAGQPPLGALLPNGQNQTVAPRAYFADTAGDLQAALSAILAQISEGQTTRAVPAYSAVTSNITYTAGSTASNQNTFYASFSPGVPTASTGALSSTAIPWTGDIRRQRYICSQTPPLQNVTPSLGDDFGQDLAVTATRHFIAIQPSTTPTLDPTATIRPYDTAPGDGLGTYTGTQYEDTAANIVSAITPTDLGLPTSAQACQYTSTLGNGTGWLNPTQCAAMLLDFTFGQAFSASGFPFVSRTGTTAQGEALAFGGLYHASPVVVGPPGSLLHDDSYDLFRTWSQTTTPSFASSSANVRDTIVYAATTDGLLHAFWSDEPNLASNEEWAFLPPAVMPQLLSAYPGANQFLLDGTPIVKDVIWDRPQGSTTSTIYGTYPWRTTLVAGFGPAQKGYYALDVTNPTYKQTSNTIPPETGSSAAAGPTFLWQLTKTPATNMPLFGAYGTTPAITQVAINQPDGTVHEVGVAILPGGWNSAAVPPAGTNPGCERDTHHRHLADWSTTGGFLPWRTSVRCWGATGNYTDNVIGRSVTVVRLDNGEVIATFMRQYDASNYFPHDTLLTANPSRINDTPLDSPMTGTPAVYPSQTGVDATKFYIGDMDGTIWRFDISNPNPTLWTGRLFFDMYNSTADPQSAGDDWGGGEPIVLPLVTSLDRQGRIVIHAASGSTDSFDLTGPNYLVSVTETVQTIAGLTDFHAGSSTGSTGINWWVGSPYPGDAIQTPMSTGERVSGPMVVFNNVLYYTTYYAGSSSSNVCAAGDARLWAADYINANANGPGTGGIVMGPVTGADQYLDLTTQGVPAGVVVPGISLQQTTACATVNTGADQYVPGAQHATTSSYTAGSFSLVAQIGKASASGGVPTYSRALNPPSTSTLIDSWATVTE